MASVDAIADQIRALLPLEEEKVEAFDRLVGELAEVGGSEAARELLILLNDDCDLGGVMEGVAVAIQSLSPVHVADAVGRNLDAIVLRGRRHLGAVLRWLVSSDIGRAALIAAGRDLTAAEKDKLREELQRVARFPKYVEGCREVEAAL